MIFPLEGLIFFALFENLSDSVIESILAVIFSVSEGSIL